MIAEPQQLGCRGLLELRLLERGLEEPLLELAHRLTEVDRQLERRIRLSDRVLRSLTVRLEPNWATVAKEQAVRDAQARAEAAERERERAEQAAQEPEPSAAEAGPPPAETTDEAAAEASGPSGGVAEPAESDAK